MLRMRTCFSFPHFTFSFPLKCTGWEAGKWLVFPCSALGPQEAIIESCGDVDVLKSMNLCKMPHVETLGHFRTETFGQPCLRMSKNTGNCLRLSQVNGPPNPALSSMTGRDSSRSQNGPFPTLLSFYWSFHWWSLRLSTSKRHAVSPRHGGTELALWLGCFELSRAWVCSYWAMLSP